MQDGNREFIQEDVDKIAETYHNRKKSPEKYEDIKWYYKSTKLEDMENHSFVLTPWIYVWIPAEEDDWIPFEDKIQLSGKPR